jgi:hypothetical protein|nr:MAG TPA: hypothetical protein [Caudoviricetes sp.]
MTREEARELIKEIHWAESPYTGCICARLPYGLSAYLERISKRRTVIEVWKMGYNKPMRKLYGDIRRSEDRLKKLIVTYIVNRKI